MLDFEAAFARALARAGVAPAASVAAIVAQCNAEIICAGVLAREAALAGNLAIPLVKALTAAVAKSDAKAAGFVHWGATSQDAIDTGLVLQLREALDLIAARTCAIFQHARATRGKASMPLCLPGRTWLQQASPVTLGLKVAGWLDAIDRQQRARRASPKREPRRCSSAAQWARSRRSAKRPRVAAALAEELKLTAAQQFPGTPIATVSREVAATLGLLVGTLGKIARDISLLAQTEVGEVLEPAESGRGGSSTLPHKRNPVGAAVVLAAAIRVPALVSVMLAAMVQEHERGLGGWHAEWETLPEIFLLAAGALAHLAQVVDGLEVVRRAHDAQSRRDARPDPQRSCRNRASQEHRSLARAPAGRTRRAPRPRIRPPVCANCCSKISKCVHNFRPRRSTRYWIPENYTGAAESMIQQVLADEKKQR